MITSPVIYRLRSATHSTPLLLQPRTIHVLTRALFLHLPPRKPPFKLHSLVQAMAKRKPLRPYKYGTASYNDAIALQPYRQATLLHPVEIHAKAGVGRAHFKHQNDNAVQGPKPHCLADHFYALPAELRAHIFSFLLVQPVKWNLDHDDSCSLFRTPIQDIRPQCRHYTVESSVQSTSLRQWRIHTSGRGPFDVDHSDMDPWRSKYAPEVANCFMGSDDWDDEWRAKVIGFPFPKLNKDMPCLCARRRNLDVLLVCRKWYEEASRVLWGSNAFAFDTCEIFADFAATCTARDKVTRVSILRMEPHHPRPSWEPFEWPDWAYHKNRQALIVAIRNLPSLTHLELDSCLLRDVRDVQALLRLGMTHMRSVRFIYHEYKQDSTAAKHLQDPKRPTHRIHPSLRDAVLLRGGLAEEVARAIKCEHRCWTKHKETSSSAASRQSSNKSRKRQKPGTALLQTAVQQHIAFEDLIKTRNVRPERIIACDDTLFWAHLWWKTGGRLHWSQSYLGLDEKAYEQQTERNCTVKEREGKEALTWSDLFPFANWEL